MKFTYSILYFRIPPTVEDNSPDQSLTMAHREALMHIEAVPVGALIDLKAKGQSMTASYLPDNCKPIKKAYAGIFHLGCSSFHILMGLLQQRLIKLCSAIQHDPTYLTRDAREIALIALPQLEEFEGSHYYWSPCREWEGPAETHEEFTHSVQTIIKMIDPDYVMDVPFTREGGSVRPSDYSRN